MLHAFASVSRRAGRVRALAIVVAVAVGATSSGCATVAQGVDASLSPDPGLAGIVVRVFDSSGDRKAGRVSTRPVSSALECADESSYEAFGSVWSLTDAAPGSCWLTVTYSPPGSPPGNSTSAVSGHEVTLRADETASIDVVMHRTSLGTVFLAVGAVLLAAGIVAALVGSKGEWSLSSPDDRPTEALPRGAAARPVP